MSMEEVQQKEDISSKSKKLETGAFIVIAVGLIGFIFALFALIWNGLVNSESKFDFDLLSDFGGLIAGVFGLIALGSVLLYYSALRLQTRALELQREDIELNRKALYAQIEEFKNQVAEQKLTREVFVEQSRTQKLQQFESTFSLLLKNLNDERAKLRDKFLSSNYSDPEKRQSYFWWDVDNAIFEILTNCRSFHALFDSDKITDDEQKIYLDKVTVIIRKNIILTMENYKTYLSALGILIEYTEKEPTKENFLFFHILLSGINEWELKWLYLFSFYYFEKKSIYLNLISKFILIELFESDELNSSPFIYLSRYFPPKDLIILPPSNQ